MLNFIISLRYVKCHRKKGHHNEQEQRTKSQRERKEFHLLGISYRIQTDNQIYDVLNLQIRDKFENFGKKQR